MGEYPPDLDSLLRGIADPGNEKYHTPNTDHTSRARSPHVQGIFAHMVATGDNPFAADYRLITTKGASVQQSAPVMRPQPQPASPGEFVR